MTYQELQAKYEEALSRVKELEKENARLKRVLQEHRIAVDEDVTAPKPVPKRRLKGREDVFARRWQGKENAGYQPACLNDKSPVCWGRKHKCLDCPNRELLPLTYDDVYKHLEGKNANGEDVIGLYVINEDNTCHLLCTDFDDKNCEHGYQDDVRAFVDVCKSWGVPCYVERSRSGNGAHVWIFFERPVLAVKARKLGNVILTEAMNREGRISFKSYDRFFPNQDTLPEGGLGNLVALPLQGKARKEGNSVFVDENFEPYVDQWDYLLHAEKLTETALEDILKRTSGIQSLGELSKTSESKPWEVPGAPQITRTDFSSELTITRANMLYIPLRQLSSKVLNHLKRIASFRNPEFYSRQAMRFSTYSTPRVISCAEITNEYLALPRGCEDAVTSLLKEKGVTYRIEDRTNHGRPISVHFTGTLRNNQQYALNALVANDNGVLSATTAFGKTATGIALISKHSVNTLILVHTKALLDQWVRELEKKKAVSPIGTLSSTGNKLHGIIDIALMQSCISEGEVKPFVKNYGMVIADECHHVSAVNFEQILKAINARYVYGLTATPIRKDGHQPIIFMQCGPIRYIADVKSQMREQTFQRLLVPRFTPFRPVNNEELTFAKVVQQLAEDENRNLFIVKDVVEALKEGRSPIILTNRTSHVTTLAEFLKPHCLNVITLIGSESTKEKRQKMEQLQSIPASEPIVIVAIGKYVGEGFDYAQIYDYIDIRVPVCESMYRKRLKGYASIGYRIRNDEMFGSLFPTTDVIYDGRNFEQPFISNLSTAKHSVVISCPRIQTGRHSRIADRLVDLAARGIEIVLYTREINDEILHLQCQGISVVITDRLSLHAAIIDKGLIWYGSVKILGYHSMEDNLIRFRNPEIATNLLESLVKR